jgi:hypothetical protein
LATILGPFRHKVVRSHRTWCLKSLNQLGVIGKAYGWNDRITDHESD